MLEAKVTKLLAVCISAILLTSCGAGTGPGTPPYGKLSGESAASPGAALAKDGVRLMGQDISGLSEAEVRSRIKSLSAGVETEAKNASLNAENWDIIPGSPGKRVNADMTIELLRSANPGDNVSLAVEETKPPVTSDGLRQNLVVIGSYTTPLLNRSGNRVNNIEVASNDLDYTKVAPGEVFSFNEELGRRTKSKGYEKAPVIKKTKQGKPKKDYGVGGGVCQLSTTIYNAVEEGGLEILERHHHSKDIGYVPRGEDAAVNYGTADFKFRNNRKYPVMIRIFPAGKSLTVKIIENRN